MPRLLVEVKHERISAIASEGLCRATLQGPASRLQRLKQRLACSERFEHQ